MRHMGEAFFCGKRLDGSRRGKRAGGEERPVRPGFHVPPGFHSLSAANVLPQQFPQGVELFGCQGSLREDVEAGGRGVKQDLVAIFERENVVSPFDVRGPAIPSPVSAGSIKHETSWSVGAGLFGKLSTDEPARKDFSDEHDPKHREKVERQKVRDVVSSDGAVSHVR